MTESILARSDRLRELVEDATVEVHHIDWTSSFGIPYGACIPMAVFVAEYLSHRGIEARPVEAGARFVDPVSVKYAEIEAFGGEPGLDASNTKGLIFLGHLVAYVPTFQAVFDMSLPTQDFTTLGDLGKPHCLVGTVDHRKGEVGFQTALGRGYALYRIYPKRDGWKKRAWPFDQIRDLAQGDSS